MNVILSYDLSHSDQRNEEYIEIGKYIEETFKGIEIGNTTYTITDVSYERIFELARSHIKYNDDEFYYAYGENNDIVVIRILKNGYTRIR